MEVVQDAKKTVSFLTHHLILTGILLAGIALGIWGIQGMMEKHDQAERLRAHEDLATVVEQVKNLEQTQAAHDQAAAEREARTDALVNTLLAQIAARDKALDEQIKKNATLTAAQAAAKISDQYKAQPGEVTASGDNVLVDLPVSRQIVSTYDSLQTCKADLTDTQEQLTAVQGVVGALKTQVSDRDATIAAKNTELEKQKKADDEDKKVAVDHEKKKHKWYALGGILLIEAVKVYFTGRP